MPTFTFLEEIESLSPTQLGATEKEGRHVSTYLVNDIKSVDDIQNFLFDAIGGTYPFQPAWSVAGQSTGPMQRLMPLQSPVMSQWYCSNTPSLRGVGQFSRVPIVAGEDTNGNQLLEFALYNYYWATIEFTPRPYAVVPDNGIPNDNPVNAVGINAGGWVNDAGVFTSAKFPAEWLRYTFFDQDPQNDSITFNQGQLLFKTANGLIPGNYPFVNKVQIFLPNQMIKFRWFGVPYRYISSPKSYLNKYLGRINQLSWNGYAPASLLYIGYKPTIYTPSMPYTQPIDPSLPTIQVPVRLCNIEFYFLLTTRVIAPLKDPTTLQPAVPAMPEMPPFPVPGNQSIIAQGWNLQPWNDRLFHYVQSSITTSPPGFGSFVTLTTPVWKSFPIQALFQDPDFSVPYISM